MVMTVSLCGLACLHAETMMMYARRKAPTLTQVQISVVENVAGRSSGWPDLAGASTRGKRAAAAVE